MKTPLPPAALVLLASFGAASQASAQDADLARIADPAVWRTHNRAARLVEEDARKVVRLDARAGDGLAWLLGSSFADGTIEVELRGRDLVGQSFVGVAFRGRDDETYDAVYFRPFNFGIEDPARRLRAVQYVSHPAFTWDKLRASHPGVYEQPVSPVPDPNGWIRARIVLEGRKVSVFVEDAAKPSLVVTELSGRRGGLVGLWVGNGSEGAFARLSLRPAAPRD
jgi:hypothetical protein